MGTNYYYIDDEKELHIGKSSFGWVFAMRVHYDHNITSYEDWKNLFNYGKIINEYGENVSIEKMKSVIEERTPANKTTHNLNDRYSEIGPNGLYRTKKGLHCVEHFDTWETIVNEFS